MKVKVKINFLTLFPKFYEYFDKESIIKRAVSKKLVSLKVVDFRQFTKNKHQKVDDEIFGGGQGMLLTVEPIDRALQTVGGLKILITPQGQKFNQSIARQLAHESEITLIAGHYEGFDERVRSLVDLELSIGDYVLTGGELPSLVIADCVIRLLPDVIKKQSHEDDSFSDNLLEYPQYTRPRHYKGMDVPEVLLSGDHKKIALWRKQQALEKTKKRRPDLLKRSDNEK